MGKWRPWPTVDPQQDAYPYRPCSQLLVAFTVEFDNEFEHQMPHRTTRHGLTPGSGRVPWLVSMAMWVHCMRFVPEDGIPVGELARRIRWSRPAGGSPMAADTVRHTDCNPSPQPRRPAD